MLLPDQSWWRFASVAAAYPWPPQSRRWQAGLRSTGLLTSPWMPWQRAGRDLTQEGSPPMLHEQDTSMCGSSWLPSTFRVHLTSVLNWGKPSALGPRQIVKRHPPRPEPLLLLQRTGREPRKQGPLQMVSQLWQLVLCKALSYLWPALIAKPVMLAVGVGRQARGCPLLIWRMWDTRQNLRHHTTTQRLRPPRIWDDSPQWELGRPRTLPVPPTLATSLNGWVSFESEGRTCSCWYVSPLPPLISRIMLRRGGGGRGGGPYGGRVGGRSFPLGNGHCDHNAGTHGACAQTLTYDHAQTYSCLGSSLSCYPFYSSTAVNYDPLSCKWVSKIFSKIYSTDCMLIQ